MNIGALLISAVLIIAMMGAAHNMITGMKILKIYATRDMAFTLSTISASPYASAFIYSSPVNLSESELEVGDGLLTLKSPESIFIFPFFKDKKIRQESDSPIADPSLFYVGRSSTFEVRNSSSGMPKLLTPCNQEIIKRPSSLILLPDSVSRDKLKKGKEYALAFKIASILLRVGLSSGKPALLLGRDASGKPTQSLILNSPLIEINIRICDNCERTAVMVGDMKRDETCSFTHQFEEAGFNTLYAPLLNQGTVNRHASMLNITLTIRNDNRDAMLVVDAVRSALKESYGIH